MTESLGVLQPTERMSLFATFIVDPDRVVRFSSAKEEILRVLDAPQTGELVACNWQKKGNRHSAKSSAKRANEKEIAGIRRTIGLTETPSPSGIAFPRSPDTRAFHVLFRGHGVGLGA
jgi:hypothetical protein